MSECKPANAETMLELIASASSVRAALAQFVALSRQQGYGVNAACATLTFYEEDGDFFGRWEIGNITEDVPFVAVVGGSL